jgi:hypothetical protein
MYIEVLDAETLKIIFTGDSEEFLFLEENFYNQTELAEILENLMIENNTNEIEFYSDNENLLIKKSYCYEYETTRQ